MFGVIKKLDVARGFAFIEAKCDHDVFVSIAENSGVVLNFRDEVEFELIRIKGKLHARKVKVLDPLRFYKISEDRHGWFKARRGSFTVVYGASVDEIRQRLASNPGFFAMSASPKSCDRTPPKEIYGLSPDSD